MSTDILWNELQRVLRERDALAARRDVLAAEAASVARRVALIREYLTLEGVSDEILVQAGD